MDWKLTFHPDDMILTEKRWNHSLATGEPYSTEYRCRPKNGEWRWMLGRALPMKNMQTCAIEKWYETCTDIHEAVQTRFAARRMVSIPNHSVFLGPFMLTFSSANNSSR